MKNKLLALCLLSDLFLLTGCVNTTHNVQRYAQIDSSNKTITVRAGSAGLLGRLKKSLADDGWKLYVDGGPSVTEGVIGQKTKIMQHDSFNSRYRLTGSTYQFDVCTADWTPKITYDLSLIDNKSGTEVFTMNGSDCESGVAEKFTEVLHGKDV